MTELQIRNRLYPSVVTYIGDWRKMVAAVRRYELTDISLFLTAAGYRERREIYAALAGTAVKRIPHVHARHDMRPAEYAWLTQRYGTQAFTLHFQYLEHVANLPLQIRRRIFIENNDGRHAIKDPAALRQVGGLCIDLSHYYQFAYQRPDLQAMTQAVVQRYRIGCNHLSAMRPNGQSWHRARSVGELKYVTEIPKRYFSQYICFELANPIHEQLRFRQQVAKWLATAWR